MNELDDKIESALRDAVLAASPGRAGEASERIDDVRSRAQRFSARRRRTRAVIGGLVLGRLSTRSAWFHRSARLIFAPAPLFGCAQSAQLLSCHGRFDLSTATSGNVSGEP